MSLSTEMAAEELARRHPIRMGCLLDPLYDPQPFHWNIGDIFTDIVSGNTDRALVMLPPRHGKSDLCSTKAPPYYLQITDNSTMILASYAANLAIKLSKKARNNCASRVYSDITGLGLDSTYGRASDNWGLTNGSEFMAAGVGGSITGSGAKCFLIDDPYKNREQADSAVYREKLKDWYKDVALTRLTPDGAMVIIMTRWHYDDLVGWLLREWPEENWKIYRFPALQDVEPSALDPRRPGDALWQSRFSKEWLTRRREEIGPRSFNCLYQQTPSAGEGGILKVEWVVQDFSLKDPPEFNRVVSSWDTAFEKHSRADWTVGTVWGDTGTGYYLIDVYRGRWTFPVLRKVMLACQDNYKCNAVLVERAASGRDIIHELRDTSDMPVIAIKVTADKVQRADAVSGRFEAGRIHMPKSAPWLAPVFQEMEQFPDGKHDDIVDSMTQAVRWMTKYSSVSLISPSKDKKEEGDKDA